MSKLFQVYEDDLAEMERTIPQILDAVDATKSRRMATQFRRLKTILSNIRWDYGPHDNVEVIEP